jgi:hypothetical protein
LNQQTTILHLKFPVELCRYAITERKLVKTYETNRFAKNITAFIILKAESRYSLIKNWTKQIDYLSRLCQCERQTMKARIKWMAEKEFITFEGSHIRLKSWKHISNLLYINLDKFNTLQYDCTKDSNLHLRLFTTEIEENKSRQLYMVQKKLQQNPGLHSQVKTILEHCGADVRRFNNTQYFINALRKVYKESFRLEPALHKILNQVRPDCNRGIKGMAYAWDFKCKQSVSYYKKKMQESGIAVIHKGERITSIERSRNRDCHVIWDNRKKATVLALVDIIEVVKPLHIAA